MSKLLQDATSGPAVPPAPRAAVPAASAGRSKQPISGRFYACIAILLVSAAGMQGAARAFESHFRKQPLPLKRSLYQLDPSKLGPEYGLARLQPEKIPEDMVENLGTEEYLNWFIVDRRLSKRDPAAQAHLFVTYYTGKPDMVPHNPKECLGASGFTLVDESEISVPVRTPEATVEIPVNVLQFEPPGRSGMAGGAGERPRLVVLYFFYCNGQYLTTRTQVRTAVSNLADRYAYYSKFEITFSDESRRVLADRQASIEAARALLQKVMPVFLDDHFQDWKAIKSGAAPAAPSGV